MTLDLERAGSTATAGGDGLPAAEAGQRRCIFIGGAEGSGTTLLLRLLSAPAGGAALGGNHFRLPPDPAARRLAAAFEAANRQLWDRKLSFEAHAEARRRWREAMAAILAAATFADTSRFFFKRSFPFATPRDRYAPDLWDVADLWPDGRILTIYRDPRAATYSAFRRGFDTDLRRLAVTCCEQLTWLDAQVRALGRERVLTLSYAALCASPLPVLAPVAAFCGMAFGPLAAAVAAEPLAHEADDRWARELPPGEAAWLDEFFDCRRRRQWETLVGSQQEAQRYSSASCR